MIDDIDCIARINQVCNDVGVDTMDVGGACRCNGGGPAVLGDGATALDMSGRSQRGATED